MRGVGEKALLGHDMPNRAICVFSGGTVRVLALALERLDWL